MGWVAVSSSAVEAYAYDEPSSRLKVRWSGGREYEYDGVTRDVLEGFVSAESKGRFLSERVRADFPYRSLEFRPALRQAS